MRWFRRTGPDPLGDGVWRRAHDRFERACQRVHGAWTSLDEPLRAQAAAPVARLGELLAAVGDACRDAQAQAPSAGHEVPGGAGGRWLDGHRALSRAGNLAAQVAQALTMAVAESRAGDDDAARARVVAAARSVQAVEDQVSRAVDLLRTPRA